jgi:signal transduction histidine kinase
VRVCVRNQVGPAGLPDADKVFDKYYRSPGAHRKTGSGLGLYLVKSYMQLLGGYVGYAVVADEVEFSIWMPC